MSSERDEKTQDAEGFIQELSYEMIIMPSGSFASRADLNNAVAQPAEISIYGSYYPTEFYNTMTRPGMHPPVDRVEVVGPDETEEVVRAYADKRSRILLAPQVPQYAQQLFSLAKEKARFPAHCVICPLRGGLDPVIYAKLVNALPEPVDYLKYTAWKNPGRSPIIKDDLRRVLQSRMPEEAVYRIAIIDTAKGGYGAPNLAKWITDSKPKNSQTWEVRFYLLKEGDDGFGRISLMKEKIREDVACRVHLFPVQKLVREDWDAALGYRLELREKRLRLEQLPRVGRLITVRPWEETEIVESSDIRTYLDTVVSDALSNAVCADETLEFTGRDVWPIFLRPE